MVDSWVVSLCFSTVLLIVVIVLRTILQGKVSARFLYALWGIAAIRLLFPFSLYEIPVTYEHGTHFAAGQMTAGTMSKEALGNSFVAEAGKEIKSGQEGSARVEDKDTPGFDKEKRTTESIVSTVVDNPSATTLEAEKERGFDILFLIWAAAAGGIFLTFIIINIRVGYRVRKCRVKAESEKYVKIHPPVYWCSDMTVPCLYGVLRPIIYLPHNIRTLDEKEQELILQHEKMHYLHGDFFWNMMRILIVSLYWFHPLVWLGVRLSRMDAEFAVDESVIRCEDEAGRFLYGQSILHFLRTAKTDRPLWRYGNAAVTSKREMIRRLKMITDNKKKSWGIMVLTAVFMVVLTACSFGGASAGNRGPDTVSGAAADSGEPVSGESISRETATQKAEDREEDKLTEAEHKAISKAILKEQEFMMQLDSSGKYLNVEYFNPVEAHEIMGVERIGNGKKRVYLYLYWAAYGKGSLLHPEEKNCYDERGTLEDLCVITLEEKEKEGWQVAEFWSMYGMFHIFYPEGMDKKYKKKFRKYYPDGMTEEEDVMFCYMQTMAGKCNQKALIALKENHEPESGQQEKFKKKKLRKQLDNIHVYTPEYFAICFSSDEDAKWCESIRKLYNTAEFVPVTDGHTLDVENAITLNMETVGSERAQLIIDADGYCFVRGEPYTYRIEGDFDCGELYSRIRESLAARRDKQKDSLGS